eukprot:6205296-Pleurochrysis_carterae.AAC.3
MLLGLLSMAVGGSTAFTPSVPPTSPAGVPNQIWQWRGQQEELLQQPSIPYPRARPATLHSTVQVRYQALGQTDAEQAVVLVRPHLLKHAMTRSDQLARHSITFRESDLKQPLPVSDILTAGSCMLDTFCDISPSCGRTPVGLRLLASLSAYIARYRPQAAAHITNCTRSSFPHTHPH